MQIRYRRIAAVLCCTLVYGPLALAFNIANHALEDDLRLPGSDGWPASKALLGVVNIDVASLPFLLVYLLIMHVLGRLDRDSFTASMIVGGAVGYLGVAVFALALFGELPGHSQLSDAVLSVALGTVVGLFYWAISTRKERAERRAREIDQAAIRAMD